MLHLVRALATATCIALIGATTPGQTLPVGTPVTVHLVQPLSSGTATRDEIFNVRVAEPVVVNHHILIDKGATGSGRVVSVTKATGKAPGEIVIELFSVQAVDGTPVHLHTYTNHAETYEYGKAHTAAVVGTLLTGPIGLFSHNMVKGKDVTVGTDQLLPGFTSALVSVNIPEDQ